MATINWNNGKPSFDYANNAALGVNLSRQVNAPLDVSSEFSSVKDMLYYVTEGRYPASGTGVSDKVKSMTKYPYLGQIIALVDTDAETVAVYYIKTAAYDASLTTDDEVFDHYFAEVGKATIGDDRSIVLDIDTGILSLNDYGVQYYEYDNEIKGYKSTPTPGWKAGLIPQVISDGADGTKLAWFEPNPTTVEGLQTEITTIKSDITGINTTIGSDDKTDSVKGRIKTLEDTTVKISGDQDIAGVKTFSSAPVVPTPTADNHAANKGYVDSAISGLGSVFELKSIMTEAEFNALAGAVPAEYEAGDVILVTITGAEGNKNKEYVVVLDGETKKFELLGDPSGVTALEGRMTTAEGNITDLDGRMDTAESNITTNTSAISDINTAIGDDSTANSIKGRIKANETAITNLGGRMNTAEGNITTNTNTIADINADIGSDAVADSIKGRINANKTAIDTINTKLNTVAEGAQVNVLEKVELGTGVTGTVEFGTDSKAKTQTINITKVSNAGTADTAKATEHTLTVFSKTFNGSADVTVTETDIGAATDSKLGLVKSSTGNDHVTVAVDGTMTVSKVSSAANAATAGKVANALKFGSDTYDGSSEKKITLTGLGFDSSAYATAEQGSKADSAIQSITIAGQAATGGTAAVITADQLKTGLGLGTAAYKADTYFATADVLTTLDGEAVKKTGDQTISGTKTFSSPVVVATPTEDSHATTKKYVDDELAAKMSAIDSMTFKGLLGDGEGNVSTLPTENVKNGDTYKVITAGTYAEHAAKVSDMFIALVKTTGESQVSITWTLIPSGDENNGNVMAGATLTQDQLIVGNGSQDVKTLAAGTNGKILRVVDGKPAWDDETSVTINGSDSIDVSTTGTTHTISVKDVNANLISQTEGDYLVLDGGSSTVNI